MFFSYCLFLSSHVFGQNGKVFDNLAMQSKILNSKRQFSIYLPQDYETSQRSYPVLYLLHGRGDDHTGWVQFGEVLLFADRAISNLLVSIHRKITIAL
jgi:enterochelin esterase-like enzyme